MAAIAEQPRWLRWRPTGMARARIPLGAESVAAANAALPARIPAPACRRHDRRAAVFGQVGACCRVRRRRPFRRSPGAVAARAAWSSARVNSAGRPRGVARGERGAIRLAHKAAAARRRRTSASGRPAGAVPARVRRGRDRTCAASWATRPRLATIASTVPSRCCGDTAMCCSFGGPASWSSSAKAAAAGDAIRRQRRQTAGATMRTHAAASTASRALGRGPRVGHAAS